jgi:ribosome assembly protein 1
MPKSIFGKPANTRLVTIAAHVDHGKTTLADNLIERNGIISERAAGTLRYLDSDPEEQRRGITMRSSAIGLQYKHVTTGKEATTPRDMIIHLLDSPGHTDFSREVSSSMLACDAAILVVDAVEGMGARTQQVFRETDTYQLTPVLVINKIDKLHTELCLSPTEAYLRLRSLLETVNAAAASMINSAQLLSQETAIDDKRKEQQEKLWTFDPAAGNVIFASALFGWGFTVQSMCRSLFRNGTVAIKPPLLRIYLFGDYKLKGADKIVKWKQSAGGDDSNVPLFAEFALQPIWSIYEGVAVAAASVGLNTSSVLTTSTSTVPKLANSNGSSYRIQADTTGMDRVLEALRTGTTMNSQHQATFIKTVEELQAVLKSTGAGGSEDATLRAILRRYRPLADAVLDVVCDYCPSPATAASEARSHALALQEPPTTSPEFERIRQAVKACDDAADAHCVAHVCKFLSTDLLHVRDSELFNNDGDNKSLILGLARVLSGRLHSGNEYFVFGPKHNTGDDAAMTPPVRKIRLYLLMGSSFVRVEEVPAGHLCAIYGLEDVQLKTATLSDNVHCQPLCGFTQGIRPLVKVNIEPELTSDAEFLERGLTKLSMADAAVEVTATDKGERILACLGELHLEQSILDLERVYCGKEGIKLRVSDPIVDFAESTDWFEKFEVDNYTAFFDDPSPILRQATIPPYNEEEGIAFARHGRTRAIISGRSAAISVRVIPLADSVYQSLRQGRVYSGCEDELLKIGSALNCSGGGQLSAESVFKELLDSLCSLGAKGNVIVESAGVRDGSCVRGVEAEEIYVPAMLSRKNKKTEDDEENGTSPADVVCGIEEYDSLRASIRNGGLSVKGNTDDVRTGADAAALGIWTKSMKGSVVAGFEMAIRAGPICEEPMRNVMVVLEGAEVAVKKSSDGNYQASMPIAGGMVVSALRSGIRCALLSRPARLMEGILRLTLHSSLAGLGALYQVLSKRRGRVVEDSMVDGTDLLMIAALIPQAEAFGLAPELFGKTSGEVTAPEMLFSHWERLDVDPFWIPTSEEEREDFGELQTAGDSSTGLDNTALSYIRKVRKRKGLTVDSSRTVQNAEKQRTLKR